MRRQVIGLALFRHQCGNPACFHQMYLADMVNKINCPHEVKPPTVRSEIDRRYFAKNLRACFKSHFDSVGSSVLSS
jgi:hypothetical protein